MRTLDEHVHTAHGDAWQAEGRIRQGLGGGVAEFPGVRLMASGLQHGQWNNGDVIDPGLVRVEDVRAWYATRAYGSGVPWGLRVPAGARFRHGRRLFRKRCMGLLPEWYRAFRSPPDVAIEVATAKDVSTLAAIDAATFGDPIEQIRPWVEPHIDAPGFTAALARLGGEPVGIATAIFTEDRAGPCVGIFGVGTLEHARRQGVASTLTSWIVERAFAVGATLAHINPDSDDAARLYARLGFTETAGLDIYAGV